MNSPRDKKGNGLAGNRVRSFSVAVVEPEFPLNVGYLARTMANFGIKQLLIVSGKKMSQKDTDEAAKFASHGSHIIDTIQYARSINDLKKRFHLIVGTTAIRGKRKSNITRKTMDVEECAEAVSANCSRSQAICILFGRDTTGLTNSELQQCDYALTIKTGTDYNTLNISHSAAIVFYVFLRGFYLRGAAGEKSLRGTASSSTRDERNQVISLYEDLAVLSDFQKFKRGKLAETLSRLLNRSSPSLRELYLLMGLANKVRTRIRTLESRRRNTS